ncbi:carbon-nitrogen hydrolase family protein [Litorilituus sediminis]|uniref:Carbon-nitrogen hydrolase family protein n=1 Tax=Litorilituus sediminis TaxID=718192 RepID=A0A4P6P9I6_9GAMM|nr:carbon-nitrogen hydrolase family protein [Litorilituus sediminis]QBG36197.1 carbon-nitrogen hydrolase family protein [Litorilituus sediminis]
MVKVAIIQESPCVLDKQKTIAKAVEIIAQLAKQGAQLIVFPEAYIPGYPAWIWRLRPGGDWGTCEALHKRLLSNAVDLSSDDIAPLLQAAKDNNITLVCGINERDGEHSRATLFNTVITINHQGQLVNHHRKLMPTNPERMVWGLGDAHGLNVIDTQVGRIGQLICWENYMPLARYALYAQGIEIYIAPTYDSGDDWLASMKHIAREGKCWLLNCGVALQRQDLPSDLPELENLYPADEDWINPGDSAVISPQGEVVAGPMNKCKGHLLVDIDVELSSTSKRALDITGHYARPDVFTLTVDRTRLAPINFIDKSD